MKSEQAETLALKGLAHLAQDEGLLSAFLNLSGMDVADLRARAGEPETLAAVMDFLLADDTRILAFCEACELTPLQAHAIRKGLPGSGEI